jgi:hypothetical protein
VFVLEMVCGCQVEVEPRPNGAKWEIVRQCQALKVDDPQLHTYYRHDHVHAIMGRICELRGTIQRQ